VSEPAIFVVIEQGQKRFYYDRWAHVYLFRNLTWGREALDKWLAQEAEGDDWSDDVCGGAVIDYDRKRLVWNSDDGDFSVPRVARVLDQLLRTAWPGYEIEYAARGVIDLEIAAGKYETENGLIEEQAEDAIADRVETVREAAGIYDDDDDVDEEEDEYDEAEDDEDQQSFDDNEARAWVTLVNEQGAVRHRHLNEIPQDMIRGKKTSIAQLLELNAAEVPPEAVVNEGIWFDFGRREIGYWGGVRFRSTLAYLQQGWPEWSVRWADAGYRDQCAVSGPSGIEMSDAEALAKLVPKILSTKRIDLGAIFGAIGGQLKKTAAKATGCLTVLLCAPVLLFGVISGNLKAAAITIAIVVVAVIVVFKYIELRFKRKFTDGPIGKHAAHQDSSRSRAAVAGPLDAAQRRGRLDELLAAAGLPPLVAIEKHIDPDDAVGELL
jgi:hypothetical protein